MRKLFTLLTLLLCAVSMSWGAKIGFTSTKSDDKILAPTVTVQNNLVVTLAKGTQDTGSNKDNLFWGSETKLAYADGATVTQNRTQCGGAAVTSINENAWSGAKYAVASGYKFTVTDVQVDIAGQDYTWGYRLDVVNGDGTVEFTTSGTVNTPKNSSKRQVIATGKSIALTGDAYVKLYYYVTGTTSNSKYMYIPELYLTGTVEEDNSPSISASPKGVTLAATESGVPVNSSFTITGSNLTAGTYNLTIPSVTGLGVSPTSFTVDANGTVSQEVSLSYSSTENVPANTANITATVNDLNLSVAVNYSASVTSWTLQTINTAKTWDFSQDVSGGKQYTTEEEKNTEFVYANISELSYSGSFDATALAFKGEYPFRDNSHKYAQNGVLRFNTTVPGTIKVKFSDTGSSASATAVKRYLVVNDENTEYWASRANNGTENPYPAQLNVTTGEIPVPAGEVTIKGSSAIIVSYLSFTPAENLSAPITSAGWATLYTPWPLDFAKASPSGLTAYTATLSNNTVTLTEVKNVQAGTGVVLKGDAGNYTIPVAENSSTAKGDMIGDAIAGTELTAETAYILNINDAGKAQFFVNSAGTIAAGKAYLPAGGKAGAKALSVVFANDLTGITNANAAEEAAQPAKRIVNGQLVIEKNGKRYNAAGAEF